MPVVFADLSRKAENDKNKENTRRFLLLPKHTLAHLSFKTGRGFDIFENKGRGLDGEISADFTTIKLYHGKSTSDWLMSFAREIEKALDIQIIIHIYGD